MEKLKRRSPGRPFGEHSKRHQWFVRLDDDDNFIAEQAKGKDRSEKLRTMIHFWRDHNGKSHV